jgi:hypothetical protein
MSTYLHGTWGRELEDDGMVWQVEMPGDDIERPRGDTLTRTQGDTLTRTQGERRHGKYLEI